MFFENDMVFLNGKPKKIFVLKAKMFVLNESIFVLNESLFVLNENLNQLAQLLNRLANHANLVSVTAISRLLTWLRNQFNCF